ncbi:hypothetical protein [Streptomyces sp. NPDC048650]|uniref:hypothetical protein n=1 Tax=Streptomyces sp. NPDC048650 TaxID=3365583 RepID=UPI0037125ACC
MATLADHRAVPLEHLGDEAATLLPLAAEHITEKEWASLGDHLVANTPKLTLFGLVLEDANRRARHAPVRPPRAGTRHLARHRPPSLRPPHQPRRAA